MRLPFLALFCLGLSSAPLVVSANVPSPTEESATPDGLDGFRDLESVLRPVAERLLACDSEASFLAALDAELFRTELWARLVSVVQAADNEALASVLEDSSTHPENVVDAAVAVTSEEHRAELARGFVDAAAITTAYLAPPTQQIAGELQALATQRPNELFALAFRELGDRRIPMQERRTALAILRFSACTLVLAVASETGSVMPAWMAALTIRLWRQGHEQILARLADRIAPPLREERLTPRSSILLAFSCHEPDTLATIFDRCPAAIALLNGIAENLPRFFAEPGIDHVRVRPSADEEAPANRLLVDIYVPEDDSAASTNLDRFDEDWWLEASRLGGADIVVDIRRA